ncbi:MAG TPA: aminotransferase class V-fold PLP-dependent enzyme, partial [Actinomycetota bacterium]
HATEAVRRVASTGVNVVGFDPDAEAVPAGARLVVAPLVRSSTGERVALERLAHEAHAIGASLIADASLAVGAVPVDPEQLGADILVARSEAWLLGPEGLAILAGRGVEAYGATTGFHLPSLVGFARGCGWLSMYVGLPWVHERGRRLTERLAGRLGAMSGVRLHTPESRATTLAFSIDGWPAADALDELGRRVFLLAEAVPSIDAIRLGIGCWNTDDELDRLAEAVELLATHTPETLPRRAPLTIFGDP